MRGGIGSLAHDSGAIAPVLVDHRKVDTRLAVLVIPFPHVCTFERYTSITILLLKPEKSEVLYNVRSVKHFRL